MTIAEINEIEKKRDKEQFGVIHLLIENGFYRAHDWSAWLMTTFPFGEAVNKPLRISSKRLKDGYIEAWVGFPVSSLGKYVPNDGSVKFNPVSDTQIDVSIELSDDLMDATYDEIRQFVDAWKVIRSVNSYLGIMAHTSSYKIRRRMFLKSEFLRIGLFDEGLTKITDRKIFYKL